VKSGSAREHPSRGCTSLTRLALESRTRATT